MIKKPVGPDIPEPVKRLFYELIDEINDISDIVQVLGKDRDKREEKAQEKKKTKAEAEAGKIKAAKKLLKEQTK